ncbi:MAG: NAD-dependent epimerase/dehydratase family protein [Aeromicrobium sp.]|uniref:NAD-dependent epimerase/dehydratase family protein n=1 Tax=Aeromicrobium sp. TaxID=1871063 RepID=UPI0025BC59AE|nr:NAD-dependent epimerase/dehydratase family protein [Aeromicrobium sp.]MCK5892448.1 NAD-dependent epimerase/dehydratase family protein [Aeromicrobium sp.]MDF1704047.1 NAD-dependent epimerase/dehydratase family protein [Aeromicrobium sp.]
MRIFVTGASGFIGRHLIERFAADGHETWGVDLVADPARGVVAGNVGEPDGWRDQLEGVDVVVHTAAIVSNSPSLDQAWQVNVVGTRHVLDAAVAAGVTRFVHLSSIRVFSDLGFPDGVTEDHPVRPDGNPYVDTRIASEQVVLQAHAAGQIGVTIVRPGDVYGPGSRPWTLLPVELIRRRQFFLPAHGRGIHSPVYVDDLIEGVSRATLRPEAVGHVFTLAGGVGVTTAEFFGHYHRMLGRRPVLLPTPLALAIAAGAAVPARLIDPATEISPVAVRYFCRTGTYSIDKARRLLGYEPQVDLAVGMARTERWLREEGLL